MILLNFSHPLTNEQVAELENLVDRKLDRIIDIPVQFDPESQFIPQLGKLMESIPISGSDLQTQPILVNLPSLNYIAALLLAELHGRMGYFPPILRIRPVNEGGLIRYEVAEIINLQAVRDSARTRRKT